MKWRSKKIATVIGLIAVLASATALASGIWSPNLTVKTIDAELNSYGTGTDVFLTFTPTAHDNRPSCTTTDGEAILSGSADHIKMMSSLLTSSLLAARPVEVHWNGCTFGGKWPVIDMVILH